jgi:hypothetical protein
MRRSEVRERGEVVLLEGVDLLGDAVFGDGKILLAEAVDHIALAVSDHDVENHLPDFAMDGVDGFAGAGN